jgi:hypothetical protein
LKVYREPTPEGYRAVLTPGRDGTISPMLLTEVRLPMSEVWPAF